MNNYLILSLVIFTVFTISLTETIELADGLTASGTQMNYELDLGETQMLTWKIINDDEFPINLEFFATGEGSEFFIFEKFVTMEAKQVKEFEIFVTIPEENKDNVEYHTKLFALMKGDVTSGASQVVINVQMETHPVIKVGDNPVFTSEKVTINASPITEGEISQSNEVNPIEEKEQGETMEEKLARIQAANEDSTPIVQSTEKSIETQSGMDAEPISESTMECGAGTEMVNGICKVIQTETSDDGGGCLIATAAFGSELAPQVQFLREIRDNTLLSTVSGASFMTGFNQLYYSFSPYIADMERESPIFKETVKVFITPMLSTLSIMTLADEGSESQVLGLGISVIALNLGMYIGLPAMIIHRLRK